ncbi:hypothetical protein [Arthrobacter sedimenti]|uniref:Uncharacterized protein n=1 Tax=Arthrobacter sedimenti TaxID=2694931 RepID=A0ABV8WFU0_9MICC
MAAEDFFVHRHRDTFIQEDHLDVWRPVPRGGVEASIQIEQADGVTARVEYRAEHAPAIARAILEAVGLDPRTIFAGDLPELTTHNADRS